MSPPRLRQIVCTELKLGTQKVQKLDAPLSLEIMQVVHALFLPFSKFKSRLHSESQTTLFLEGLPVDVMLSSRWIWLRGWSCIPLSSQIKVPRESRLHCAPPETLKEARPAHLDPQTPSP